MSSFKRKVTTKQSPSFAGTRTSPSSTSTIITSTGIHSLDDILGGGLPLSCFLLISAPEHHSSYGELVQKYFVAEGLACGHRVCILGGDAEDFAKGIMWYPKSTTRKVGSEDDAKEDLGSDKVKIAWRYEQMKQFQTTVTASTSRSSNDGYCHVFDLSSTVPEQVIDDAIREKRLVLLDIDVLEVEGSPITKAIRRLESFIEVDDVPSGTPIRLCIPSLGSALWGDPSSQDTLLFLYRLRLLLRKYPYTCASLSLPPRLSAETWGGKGWVQKLGWMSDAFVTFSAFSANPSLTAIFPSYHGLVHIHGLPSPQTLLPCSDRFSTLRGLSAVSSSGGGENNLAFKCTHKRLTLETLHLDLEGGVTERRTAPATNALDPATLSGNRQKHIHQPPATSHQKLVPVAVQIEGLEESASDVPRVIEGDETGSIPKDKGKKMKKTVAFRSERPDLNDF